MCGYDNLTKLFVVCFDSCLKLHVFSLLNVEMATLPYLSNQLSPTHHQSTEILSPLPRM